MKVTDINWEIDERFEKIDYHTQSISLKGFDDCGNEYSAMAVECCGSIENIEGIELTNPYSVIMSQFKGDNTYLITFNRSLDNTLNFQRMCDGLNTVNIEVD